MWANQIQGSEPHLREKLLQSPPPADIVHLFALVKTQADNTLREIRQNLCVAENVNEGTCTGLAKIRCLVDTVLEMQNSIAQLQNEQQTRIELIDHELKTMEVQTSTTRTMLNSMERSYPTVETNFSRQIFSQIQDQEDVDHI